jgi:hypothetical protein
MRGILNFQYCEWEKKEITDLLNLVTSLTQPEYCYVTILLSRRFDASPLDPEDIDRWSSWAPVLQFQSHTRLSGHPQGCNALWHDSISHVHQNVSQGKPFWAAAWTLCLEGDDSPLTPDWIDSLACEWLVAGEPSVMGCLSYAWELLQYAHINGNCIVANDTVTAGAIAKAGANHPKGWDVELYPVFKRARGAAPTNGVMNDWNTKEVFTSERLRGLVEAGIKLHHGVKDGHLRRLVRERLGLRQ